MTPARLSRLHWLDALSPPFDQHIDRLIEIAKRILPAAEAEGEAAPPRQEEQPRQPVEELLRLLQVVAESQRPQEVPPRKQVRAQGSRAIPLSSDAKCNTPAD